MDGKDRKLMIVFEGPDMCGKSTQLDMAYDRLKEEGVSVAKWKFPDYKGKYGQDILNHLKNFNIYELGSKRAELELKVNSINMAENKLWDAKTVYDSSANIILCDRFTASQFVYDLAWIPLLRKKRLFPFGHKKHYSEFAKTVLYRVHDVIVEYAKYFDVEFIYYNQSKFIRDHMNIISPDRRIDEYDSNYGYQQVVADLFSTLELQIIISGEMDYSAARETLRTYHPQIREAVYFGDSMIRDIMEDISRDPAYAYKYMTLMTEFAPKGLCRVIDPDMGFVVQNIGSVINNMPEGSNSYEARIENSKKYTHMSTMRAIADILAARTDSLNGFEKDFNFVLCKSLVNKQSYGIPDAMKGE